MKYRIFFDWHCYTLAVFAFGYFSTTPAYAQSTISIVNNWSTFKDNVGSIIDANSSSCSKQDAIYLCRVDSLSPIFSIRTDFGSAKTLPIGIYTFGVVWPNCEVFLAFITHDSIRLLTEYSKENISFEYNKYRKENNKKWFIKKFVISKRLLHRQKYRFTSYL